MDGSRIAAPLPRRGYRRGYRRGRWPRPRFSVAGVSAALVFGCASFTPSLVPREWFVQGIVAGLSAAFGYGVGVFLAWLVCSVSGRTPSAAAVRRTWVLVACLGVPLVTWTLWLGHRWQREIHVLTEVEPPASYAWIWILLLTVVVFLAVIAVGRALRWAVRWFTGQLVRFVPERLAGPLAVIIVILLLVGLNNGLLWRGLVSATNSISGTVNSSTNEGTVRPRGTERSGSPASLISWQSLGRQGRDFVGLGPTVDELTAFSGVPARPPVRVYAGLKSAETTRSRAALAVRDLRRAGGFDRAVLVVASTTGTGLVDHSAAESIEYMHNGDTAIVGIQYSFIPSFMSLLVDQETAEDAGRELFNQVYDAWSELPREQRPKLLVTGTSLGVIGSEAAFGGLADIRNRTDGVVWVGPPTFSALHRSFVRQRAPGTPEWLPVYDAGETVRFASAPEDIWQPGRTWSRPRVVYLQNGSDPVLFWSPRLAFTKPDWLSEPRASDVSPGMFWIPVVTFWQVTADLPSTYDVPSGHGHRYGEMYVDAWAAVARPEGWDAEDARRLRALVKLRELERERLRELQGVLGAP